MMSNSWVQGDYFGITIPASSQALREDALDFLTQAFRASRMLSSDNSITRISRFEEFRGGSTGSKLILSVDYKYPSPALISDLFVKFSRDFDDPIRDRARIQMDSEVRFALLSRAPNFPITVPRCFFADYHRESGTGILIVERINFGEAGIEPEYGKCLDHLLPAPLEHYKALVVALARLAGADKAGLLPKQLVSELPLDTSRFMVSERNPVTAEKIQHKVATYEKFSRKYPQLLPTHITTPAFTQRLSIEASHIAEQADEIKRFLHSRSDLIALCHWNGQVDNAWFWRTGTGKLRCGLIDWGQVGQINMGMALAGSLMGATPEFLDAHLETLFQIFISEVIDVGGPVIDNRDLRLNFSLCVAVSGLILLDAPVLLEKMVPDLKKAVGPLDPIINDNEYARSQLHMLIMLLHLWQRLDFGKCLEYMRKITESSSYN